MKKYYTKKNKINSSFEMESFYDADKFEFVEMEKDGKTFVAPIHYRELGEKENRLYSKKVTWSDVVIHNVPLEKTFEFEDSIPEYEPISDKKNLGIIIVNERKNQEMLPLPTEEKDESRDYKKKWMNRLEKMTLNPITLPEAKKKRKSVAKYPVKPKKRKEIREEKINKSSDRFEEFTDERDTKHMEKFFDHINCEGEEYIVPLVNHGSVCPDGPEGLFMKRMMRPYYPPEHWTKPTIQWEKIWSHMDELELGRKRDYHYIKEGDFDSEGYPGPAIFFYEKDSDDLNYDFDWSSDYRWAGPWNRWVSFNP